MWEMVKWCQHQRDSKRQGDCFLPSKNHTMKRDASQLTALSFNCLASAVLEETMQLVMRMGRHIFSSARAVLAVLPMAEISQNMLATLQAVNIRKKETLLKQTYIQRKLHKHKYKQNYTNKQINKQTTTTAKKITNSHAIRKRVEVQQRNQQHQQKHQLSTTAQGPTGMISCG